MFAQTYGAATSGLSGVVITVEVDISNGIPGLDIVGLPELAVKESRERVRAAIKNAGFEFPTRRITVNLAPADLKKDSSGLDLPIAVGILAASGQIPYEKCNKVFIGELSLEGRLRGTSGILPMAIGLSEENFNEVFVAPDNAGEALLVKKLAVYAPSTLPQLVQHLTQEVVLEPKSKQEHLDDDKVTVEDFAEVRGQIMAKRALEIAAAGGHNILMEGPPGSGKTMLARRITSILPLLTDEEALEVTKIYSIAGLLTKEAALITKRPFRSPHHTISDIALIGGGRIPRPGEVTLSHNGVLFLDEFPEFSRRALEVMRQPLEDGVVTVSRVSGTNTYPAKFILVAAMNPCPCGFLTDTANQCTCTDAEIRRYHRKISGPLLDRIDLIVHVPRLAYKEMADSKPTENSTAIRERVEQARQLQRQRLSKYKLYANAEMNHRHIVKFCVLTQDAERLMQQVFKKFNLSARGYDRILKVARTIADISGDELINSVHLAEAAQFRQQDIVH